ncbi:hypothetical protein SETIT_4G116100v2 [Setaria italica]|uniref:Peptidase A1 domain-containing protein n=1 Tax=Setaria italica TaxID=4555 RepID=A0A368QTC2_SETIT|nr:hypothetical protein SETIT_4G116100v2 [Setaria italica]
MKKAAWRKFKDYLKSLSEGQKTDGKLEIAADTTSYFIFNLSVGTSSPQNISGILDITTPLVWSQCAPCTACLPPPAPTFRPNLLPTFAGLPCASQTCQRMLNQTCAADACGYIGVYGDDTNTTGYLATDTFTFDNVSVPMVFGCSGASTGEFSDASGIFGFSRRPLSLVSQLELSWFSYLWASDDSSDDSFIKFGVITDLYPEFYFVNLTGIRVDDNKDLGDIPAGTFDFRANGSGGVFLSTTMPVTFLEEVAYVVKKELASKIESQGPQQRDSSEALAGVRRRQRGDEAPNYFFPDNNTGLECLTILPSPAGVSLSLLGSLLQTGRTMTYDIIDEQLIFEAAAAPPGHSVSSLLMAFPLAVWMILF